MADGTTSEVVDGGKENVGNRRVNLKVKDF